MVTKYQSSSFYQKTESQPPLSWRELADTFHVTDIPAARSRLQTAVASTFLVVLAIELLAACQGIEFLRPLRTTTPLEKVYDLVRSVVR